MALRRALTKRLYNVVTSPAPLPLPSRSTPPLVESSQNAVKTNFTSSPDSVANGFFRRFFPRRTIYHTSSTSLPEFLSLPVGEKLKEKLFGGTNGTNGANRLRFNELAPPLPSPSIGIPTASESVMNARKLMRISQMLKVKAALGRIATNSISYSEYVGICIERCGNEDQGIEFAKMLDEAGNVIVLGDTVFLRPEQVAKSIETVISQTIATPSDPRRRELDHMETQKAMIDKKAQSLVKGELYFGLGFIVLQTLGFMRLTFWELTWEVMEPICFFVTSLHFAGAYGFFLRTSTEPSFEGYFHRRFKSKQKKLMEVHKFDEEKYNQLCRAFYPNYPKCANNAFAGRSVQRLIVLMMMMIKKNQCIVFASAYGDMRPR